MIKIALTGGIGTGKTYVSRFFVERHVPVFNADEEAKTLYQKQEVIDFVSHLFGKSVFTDEKIDFSKIAAIVFDHPDLLKRLDEFIHPLVMKRFEQWAAFQTSKIVAMESAIVFEAHLESDFDFIIVIDAPMELRIDRIKKRAFFLSDEEIKQRINNQMDQAIKREKADFIIVNDEKQDLQSQIDSVFSKIT